MMYCQTRISPSPPGTLTVRKNDKRAYFNDEIGRPCLCRQPSERYARNGPVFLTVDISLTWPEAWCPSGTCTGSTSCNRGWSRRA